MPSRLVLLLVLGLANALVAAERIRLMSTRPDGTAVPAAYPVISADGRMVGFNSYDGTLVPGDTNSAMDGFVRDVTTGQIQRVTVMATGAQSNGGRVLGLSADGRYALFTSDTGLVPGDTNGSPDIFVRDRTTGSIDQASLQPDGGQFPAYTDASDAAMSDDGRFVAFSRISNPNARASPTFTCAIAPWLPPPWSADRWTGVL
ncbi:MAG: PD40 domain-containing protein [Planctomycetes bacterium]|nr:PD40 domain-containing protein [Planctomycetota bacterium]